MMFVCRHKVGQADGFQSPLAYIRTMMCDECHSEVIYSSGLTKP